MSRMLATSGSGRRMPFLTPVGESPVMRSCALAQEFAIAPPPPWSRFPSCPVPMALPAGAGPPRRSCQLPARPRRETRKRFLAEFWEPGSAPPALAGGPALVDFEPAARDMHDPVHGDAAAAINAGPTPQAGFPPPVLGHAGARDLDDQGDVSRARVSGLVVLDNAVHDGQVRFRLASPVWDANGLLLSHVPTPRQNSLARSPRAIRGGRVRWVFHILLHNPAFDQLEAIRFGQDSGFHHLVVLIDGESFRGRTHFTPPFSLFPRGP